MRSAFGKEIKVAALIACLLLTAIFGLRTPVAQAAGGAVNAAPGSPAGQEYSIPLSNAAPPASDHKPKAVVTTPVRPTSTSYLAPAITATTPAPRTHHHHKRDRHKPRRRPAHRTRHKRVHAATVAPSRRPPGTPSASSVLSGGGTSPWVWTLGTLGLVGIMGAGVSIAARRLPTA